MPDSRNLRYAAHGDMVDLRNKTSTYGSLSSTIYNHSLSGGQFNRRLKTELFHSAYKTVNIALA